MKPVDDQELDAGLKAYIEQHMPDMQDRAFFKQNILPMAVREASTETSEWLQALDDITVEAEEKKHRD